MLPSDLIYLGTQAVLALFGGIAVMYIGSKLNLIHTTVNSNLAAQVQRTVERERENADLRVQLSTLQQFNAVLTSNASPKT